MEKELQTNVLREHMYDVINACVKKYQPMYYRQYVGELSDLVSDFYLDFTTVKVRRDGTEKSIFDFFDPNKGTFEMYIKSSTIHKLMDCARCDVHRGYSIDMTYDSSINEQSYEGSRAYDLVDDENTEDNIQEFCAEDLDRTRKAFNRLDVKMRKRIEQQFDRIMTALAPDYQKLLYRSVKGTDAEAFIHVTTLRRLLRCRVQKVTTSSVFALIGKEIKEFDRITGKCFGDTTMSLSKATLSHVDETLRGYNSKLSKEDFLTVYA